jgi:tetratricopeptide (TPR) repeat protein
MNLLSQLINRFRQKKGIAAETASAPPMLPEPKCNKSLDAQRPFEIVMEAQQAYKVGEAAQAEALFKQGIDAYRRQEPDGLDFALGRYAAFLIDQDRKDDALSILEEAINIKPNLPAIWSDYVRLFADRGDFQSFQYAINKMAASVQYPIEAEFLLSHARRAQRDNKLTFAESLARWVVERAANTGDIEGRWAALGDLGRLLERSGRTEEAVELWREAFAEGSTDPETADRLSMYFEHDKNYTTSIELIREALKRGLPAGKEELLRKRLVRCEAKIGEKGSGEIKKSTDVFAFSIRLKSTSFEPVFQLRLKPSVKDLELVGKNARCLLVAKDSSSLVDVDLTTGTEVRRIENLPLLGDTWFAKDGFGIGIRRTAAVGQGPTLLRFLDAEGRVAAESSVPDATSEIALGADLWYVGCRDGFLYGFGFDGKKRWAWETPGSSGYSENAYFRPCPYYVASRQSFAAVASMDNVYGVGSSGKTLWHAVLPNEKQTRWSYTIPFESGQGQSEAFRILGLPAGASRDQVKSAYRCLALATHPDRNPEDPDAAANFRHVQGAYERILTDDGTKGVVGTGLTLNIEIHGIGPTASFLAANAHGVVVGSSQGRLYQFDANGMLRDARVLGDGPVRAALRPDGTLGVAWCSGALLFFRENRIVNAAEALEWPQALTMFGEDVVLWSRNQVQVMDAYGRLTWSVDFSKKVNGVFAKGDMLVCAAGVLAAFRRTAT